MSVLSFDGFTARRGVLRFGLDRDEPPKPKNPYPFLRVIVAKKKYLFLRIFLEIWDYFSKFSGEKWTHV